jgi:hypothetical protein
MVNSVIGLGGSSADDSKSIAVDGSGNTYVVGEFQGTADFDPGAGTTNLSSAGNSDVFIAKYDTSGDLVWAKSVGGSDSDGSRSIDLDSSGNPYVTGFFGGTVDFDPGAGTTNLTSAGSTDTFIAKYDTSGALVWAKSVGGTSSELSNTIQIDSSGNSYVTGYFQGTADFDPGAGTSNLTSSGNNDIFIAKYDTAGALVWAQSVGATSIDQSASLRIDSSGNSYVTGLFAGAVDFDPGAGTTTLTSAGSIDAFIAKYDTSGALVWAKSIGGTSVDQGASLQIDNSGNSYVTGYFQGTADFDPGAGTTTLTSAGNSDVFIAKYDTSGGLVWAKSFGGTSSDESASIQVDSSGNSYVTGNFQGTADFDPGAGTTTLTSAGNSDIFIAKYDSAGGLVWVKSFGGTSVDKGASLQINSSGDSYVTGQFALTVDFDPDAGATNLTSAGGIDVFVVKLDSNGTVYTSPAFTSSATATAAENQTAAIDVNANDSNGGAADANVTYSLTGGADQALFDIDTNSGVVTFKSAPNFEAAADNGANNVYDIEVTASDTVNTRVQSIAITVSDVDENTGGSSSVGSSGGSNTTPTATTTVVIPAPASGTSGVPTTVPTNGTITSTPGVSINAVLAVSNADPTTANTQATTQISTLIVDPSSRTGVQTAISAFTGSRQSGTLLDVVTVTPSGIANDGGSIVMTGSAGAGSGSEEMYIVDLTSFNATGGNGNIQLDNIEFASIIGNATVTGGTGSNYVVGDGGTQSFLLGEDDDTLFGGAGNDSVGSAGGNDVVSGGEGTDTVFGGTDDDFVYGNQGADVAYGNHGTDTLFGGQGADTLFGGLDADVVYGNLADDVVYGNYGSDILYGGQGNDVLYGGQSGDIANSSGGSFDLLYGGAGDDTLYGGQGVDWIFTGSGADKIVISDTESTDVIGDFDGAAGDRLVIKTNINGQAITSGADLVARATDNTDGNAEIDLGGGYQVRLIGVRSSELTADYFEFY